jgi:hypothetical protein
MLGAFRAETIEALRRALAEFRTTVTWREIIEPRDEVLADFQPVFSPEHIPLISEREFRSFLVFKNNCHWSGLHRQGSRMCRDMGRLRRALQALSGEGRPVAARLDEATGLVYGMGHGTATAILLVMHPHRYGVWNNVSEKRLQHFGLWPAFERGSSPGQKYERVNSVLLRLRDALQVDLWTLDGLWWHCDETKPALPYAGPRHSEKPRPKKVKPSYALDLDEAEAAVRRYNSSISLVASDALLDRHFSPLEKALSPDQIAANVVLLDGLWQTRLYMEAGASDRIIANLSRQSEKLVGLLTELGPDALERRPAKVVHVAREALPAILEQEPGAGGKHRQNYSFATKFFHWCTRVHFPIVDSKARKRVNELQAAAGVRPRVRSDTAAMAGLTYVQEYERWIGFYSDLISALAPGDRETLMRADHDSQSPAYRVSNSLLRVLDKVFYIQGGGSGVGRIG